MGSSSRLGLIRRSWEGCSPVQSAMPGDTFSPIAARHFHPHAAASGFVLVALSNNAKSGNVLFGQHTCAYGRARLAWLCQQNFAGCTVFQAVTNLSSRRNLGARGALSAQWLDALGAVGAVMNKLCGQK